MVKYNNKYDLIGIGIGIKKKMHKLLICRDSNSATQGEWTGGIASRRRV